MFVGGGGVLTHCFVLNRGTAEFDDIATGNDMSGWNAHCLDQTRDTLDHLALSRRCIARLD